jgi:hypothetical protein
MSKDWQKAKVVAMLLSMQETTTTTAMQSQ